MCVYKWMCVKQRAGPGCWSSREIRYDRSLVGLSMPTGLFLVSVVGCPVENTCPKCRTHNERVVPHPVPSYRARGMSFSCQWETAGRNRKMKRRRWKTYPRVIIDNHVGKVGSWLAGWPREHEVKVKKEKEEEKEEKEEGEEEKEEETSTRAKKKRGRCSEEEHGDTSWHCEKREKKGEGATR